MTALQAEPARAEAVKAESRRLAGEMQHFLARWGLRGLAVVPVAPGELIDKITILRIKRDRLHDPDQARHVGAELDLLEGVRLLAVPSAVELGPIEAELHRVNETLWDVED